MTATNMCYNFVGFRYSLPLKRKWSSLKPATDTPDSYEKMAADSKAKDFYAAYLVNRCQGKDAGVLF